MAFGCDNPHILRLLPHLLAHLFTDPPPSRRDLLPLDFDRGVQLGEPAGLERRFGRGDAEVGTAPCRAGHDVEAWGKVSQLDVPVVHSRSLAHVCWCCEERRGVAPSEDVKRYIRNPVGRSRLTFLQLHRCSRDSQVCERSRIACSISEELHIIPDPFEPSSSSPARYPAMCSKGNEWTHLAHSESSPLPP
jgi:hypothetical protein